MSDDTNDLTRLERITWKTAVSGRMERFSAILVNEDVRQQFFGEKFIEKLSARIDRLYRNILFFGVAYTILMISLYVSQDTKKTEFEIFGYGFKNLGYYKEFLLLVAAGISPISATLSAYQRYLIAIRRECLSTLAPDPVVREFYSYVHADSYFDPLVKLSGTATSRSHGFATLLLAIFTFNLILLFLALLAASFLLQVSVIFDVATNPASSKYVNLFVVIFSLSAIALSWVIGFLQLPLPEVDLSGYTKLAALKDQDQAKYDATMMRISAESAKRERAWSAILSLVFFVVAYSGVAILWYPVTMQNLEAFITRAVPGAFLTTLIATATTSGFKNALYRWFFRKYAIESERRLTVFGRVRRVIATVRIAMPIAIAVSYALVALNGQ